MTNKELQTLYDGACENYRVVEVMEETPESHKELLELSDHVHEYTIMMMKRGMHLGADT